MLFVKEREVGTALIPVVLHMQRFGDHNFYETKRQTVFCYLNKMQTSHLQHLACHNTPIWLIKFYGQLYQILNINPRRCYKSSVSAIFIIDLCTLSVQRRRAWVVEYFDWKPNQLLCKIENFSRKLMILLPVDSVTSDFNNNNNNNNNVI